MACKAPAAGAAREYLAQGMLLDEQIAGKLAQVRALRETSQRTTGTLDAPRGSSHASRIEECMAHAVDLEREILSDYDALLARKREMGRLIARVRRPDLRLLLELRYLSQWDWQRVADALHYDRRHVQRLHDQALREVEGLLGGQERGDEGTLGISSPNP